MKEENKDLEKDLALNQKALRKRKRQRAKKIKEIKKLVRFILIALLIQTLLIPLFSATFSCFAPIDTKEATIKVDDIIYKIGTNTLILVSDGINYRIVGNDSLKQVSVRKLSKIISVGDTFSIMYYVDQGLFVTHYVIADMRSETEIYRTLEAHNKARLVGGISGIITLSFAEIAFLCVWWTLFKFSFDIDSKIKKHRKKKREKKIRKTSTLTRDP